MNIIYDYDPMEILNRMTTHFDELANEG